MTKYIARFMKNVLGENGHEVEICQRVVEVEASTKNRACEAAKTQLLPNGERWRMVVTCGQHHGFGGKKSGLRLRADPACAVSMNISRKSNAIRMTMTVSR